MMPNKIPYLFCRYSMQIGDDVLDAAGTLAALSEHQGTYYPSGPKEDRDGVKSSVVMKPRQVLVDGEAAIVWSMGFRPGHRVVTGYDAITQEMTRQVEADTHIYHADIVAVPRLQVMAIQDRSSATYLGARSALRRIRAVFRQIEDGSFSYTFMGPGDLTQVLDDLKLGEFHYTVRRINPHPPSALAQALDESFQQEGIGISRGVVKPLPGAEMEKGNGLIGAATDLASAGYGVIGAKGTTASGHTAHIPKPPFSLDKNENLEQQEKEQPLRILFDGELEGDQLIAGVVTELVRIYGGDGPPELPQVAA
jgi:hypothetical protein